MDVKIVGSLTEVTAIMAGIGALGTAAFGLVDVLKALPGGGLSRVGFHYIRAAVGRLAPPDPDLDRSCMSAQDLVRSLHAHWINGCDTASQIATAKTFIELRLTPTTAPALARVTGVDPDLLAQVAASQQLGTALSPEQTAIFARFDAIIGSCLDEAYQRADQRYRNLAKFAAIPVAVGLAILAARVMPISVQLPQAILIGLIATPIAPVAKDISSIIAAGIKPPE
jgi:hypothetical protein